VRRSARRRSGGQALVEFSIVLVPLFLAILAIADLGRGVYINNGVAQAAREIARSTSVHPCDTGTCSLGTSTETLAVIATQKNLVPGLGTAGASIAIACTTITDTLVSGSGCKRGNVIRVTVSVPFAVVTPFLGMVAPTTLTSTAHVGVP
jgi:Flp pilus assembly protein TadG